MAICLLPVPECPQSDGVLAALDRFAARHLEHLHLVEPGDGGEVEAVEAFDRGEACGLDATLPVDHLHLDETGQEADMVYAFGGALPGQFLMLTKAGGRLERLEMVGEQDLGGLTAHAAFCPSESKLM
jgi:hypothetical protein